MAARKTERLLNLVICLLATRRYLTADQVRDAVPGYGDENDEAFKRMFERDKEELRALGIPLELGTNSAWDEEPGYRIARRDYELPDISLTAEEAAAVGLAARLWHSASLADATARALLKLQAAGLPVDTGSTPVLDPRVDAAEPAFEPLYAAVRDGCAVRFTYRTGGAGQAQPRWLDPWGVVSWHGRWYAVGHDRERDATRVFRLDRIVGTVQPAGAPLAPPPPDVDLRAIVEDFAAPTEPRTLAHLLVRRGAAWSLRRNAEQVRPRDDGWDEVATRYAGLDAFAATVCGQGRDVVVLDPPELRDAVTARLRATATGATATGPTATGATATGATATGPTATGATATGATATGPTAAGPA